MAHGGSREGAGRKSTGREKTILYITPEEASICRLIIDQVRLNKVSNNQISEVQNTLPKRIEEQIEIDFSTIESNNNNLNLVSENQILKDELNTLESKYENEICDLKYDHENEISELKSSHEDEIEELKSNFRKQIKELKLEFREANYELEKEINTLKLELELEDVPVDIIEDVVEDFTIASDQRIMELHAANEGLRGINKFIAETLNSRKELTRSGLNWTPENVKKNVQRIKKGMV